MSSEPKEVPNSGGPWPPQGSALAVDPGLPGPALVVARVGWRQVLPVLVMPPLVYLALFRTAGPRVPVSRLVNPGVIGLLVVIEVALAGVCLARRGRPSVVGTYDWVAARGLLGRRWGRQSFSAIDRFSCRSRSLRGRAPVTVVTMADREGRRVHLSLGADDPTLPALRGRLRSAGATEVDGNDLAPLSRRRTWGVVALVLAVASVPVTYLLVGPLRVLPPSVAGAFTWSGCRASLAVEGRHPEDGTPYVAVSMPAAGETWRLLNIMQVGAPAVAQRTEDPPARLAHLKRDGFVVAEQAYLENDAGAVVDVETLWFSTPQGARSYDDYVNRAVCEDWFGWSGPLPSEVHLNRGKGATVRWLGADSIVEVVQTRSTPFSTPRQVEAVAAALARQPNRWQGTTGAAG